MEPTNNQYGAHSFNSSYPNSWRGNNQPFYPHEIPPVIGPSVIFNSTPVRSVPFPPNSFDFVRSPGWERVESNYNSYAGYDEITSDGDTQDQTDEEDVEPKYTARMSII